MADIEDRARINLGGTQAVFEHCKTYGVEQCVIVGRGAAMFLPPETTLRVRLVGDLKDRIAWISQCRNLSHAQAAHWVAEKDRERTQFVKSHFFKDSTDPLQYDLVLNTSRWSVHDCADLIIQALRHAENQAAAKPAVAE